MRYKNIRSALFSFVTIHTSDGQTDGQTDRQTEFRQQYRALHYMQSHGKKTVQLGIMPWPESRQTQMMTASLAWVWMPR